MDQDATEGGEQADRGHGVAPALGMDRAETEGGGAQHMQPQQATGDAHPGFIGMGHRMAYQGLADRRHGRAQPHRGLAPHGADRSRRGSDAGQRRKQLGGALAGQLLVTGLHREGRHAGPVLHRRLDTRGPGAAMDLPAGTQAPDRPTLGDLATDHQIGDLAPLGRFLNGKCRKARPARTASDQRQRARVLDIGDQGQGGAWMVLLPARLFFPLGWRGVCGGGFLRGGPAERVAGRGCP